MITATRQYRINGGTAPYEYTFTAENSCVSFSPGSGTTADGYVEVTFNFAYESCFDDAGIVLNWSDSQGCTGQASITVANVCEDFEIMDIGKDGQYTFVVAASSPSCSSVSVQWIYNTTLWAQTGLVNGSFSSRLTLFPIGRSLPANTSVQAIVTDCNGCVKQTIYNEVFCIPDAHDFAMSLYCVTTRHETSWIPIMTPVNCEASYDWDTLQFDLPAGITVERRNNNEIRFIAELTRTPGQYAVTYSVATTQGIRSTNGIITLNLIGCPATETISITNSSFVLPCDLEPGDIYEIVLDGLVFVTPPATIDWLTVQTTEPPTPLSPSITFGINPLGQRVIYYEVPDPVAADVFSWTVCDTNGNCADAGIFSVVNCAIPPDANDDEACVGCANSVTIDVLSNDTGNGSPLNTTSLSIYTSPSNGVAAVSAGQIVYTANPGFSGTDTLEYTVANGFGVTSPPATVTIEVICAGGTATITACGA